MGGEKDFSDVDHGTVVGVRWAGLNLSEAVYLLGFSHTTFPRVYT